MFIYTKWGHHQNLHHLAILASIVFAHNMPIAPIIPESIIYEMSSGCLTLFLSILEYKHNSALFKETIIINLDFSRFNVNISVLIFVINNKIRCKWKVYLSFISISPTHVAI